MAQQKKIKGEFKKSTRKRRPSSAEETKRKRALLKKFRSIPLGKEIMKLAQKYKIKISFAYDLSDREASYDWQDKTVFLDGWGDNDHLIPALAHELRHAFQEIGGLTDGFRNNIYKYIIRSRFEEADAFSFEALFAYQFMEQTGNSVPWESTCEVVPKITKAVEEAMKDYNDPIVARRAGFQAYFKDKTLRNAYDRNFLKALSNIDDNEDIKVTLDVGTFLDDERFYDFGFMNFDLKGDNYLTDIADVYLLSASLIGQLSNDNRNSMQKLLSKKKKSPVSKRKPNRRNLYG